jgi:hypothetical protein
VDNGKMDKDTEKEDNPGLMEVFMKDGGKIIPPMVKED